MKSSLILLLLVISSKSMALTLGGVDVGNGRITPSLFETIAFNSEDELLDFAEGLLNSINYGIDPVVMQIAADGGCSMDNFKFRKLKVLEFYPAPKQNKFNMKKYKAKVVVDFYDCTQPDFILHHDPDEE